MERTAARALNDAGFGVYLPERQVEVQHRRTKKWETHADLLIANYVLVEFPIVPDHEWFDRGARPTWRALLSCKGVVGPIEMTTDDGDRMPLAIPSRIVERLMADQLDMVFDDTRMARRRRGEDALANKRQDLVGRQVRVVDGPFASFEGEVKTVDSLKRLHVLIDIFGRQTPIDLDLAQVEQLAA